MRISDWSSDVCSSDLPEDRLQIAIIGRGGDVRDVIEVSLHGLGRAQAIQRMDHEERIAQPAEAVIPVAAAVRRLGDRGGYRGDDAAALLEIAEIGRAHV